jgi:hypothetical protein
MRCNALCPTSVFALLAAVSSYLERVSLRYLPNRHLLHRVRRMGPAGFEPASATWTECCVAVTPRALSRVWVMAGTTAIVERRFFVDGGPNRDENLRASAPGKPPGEDAEARTHVVHPVYTHRPTIRPDRASVDSSIRSSEVSCFDAIP